MLTKSEPASVSANTEAQQSSLPAPRRPWISPVLLQESVSGTAKATGPARESSPYYFVS